MKKLITLIALFLLTTVIHAQKNEIISKDTISIDINKVSLIEKTSEKTGKTTIYFRYENKNYNTDLNSIKNFENKSCKAYIIYNNYINGEKKVSKLLISKE